AILAVSNSGQQISERMDFADRTLRQASEALAAGNRPLAALAVRAVEEALGQIEMIFEAVDRLAGDLDNAMASVSSALAAVEADVASGQAALDAGRGAAGAGSAGTVDLAAAVAGAAQVTQSVRVEVTQQLPDPFAALRRLEQVDVRLSAALANIRDAAGRAERARVMLGTAIPAAQAEIAAVTNFITTRRGAVGSEARTRVAEAERFLQQAQMLADADPVAALAAAQQADALAERASELANNDVNDWSQPQLGGGVSMGGLGGAVLGGILLEGMLGGGRSRGGFGGGGFGWGGMVPGSFGGPGTRVRMRF
ncbi:MAG TPA: TPM domain-containing protein, partial [Micromonosporaceae bacterium]